MNKTNFLRLWLAAFLCFVAVRAVAAEPEPQAVASPSEPPLSEFNTNWQNLVEVETMPTNGIFWSASSSLPPTPFYPVTVVFPIYEFGSNDNYVYDDRGYDWTRYWEDLSGELPNRTAHLRENSAGRTRMDDPAPGSGSGQNYAITTNYLNYTNFWLSITNDPGNAWVSIESTLPGFWYGIATNGDLSTTNWGVWTNLLASNSITLAPPMAVNSGPLFFQAVLLGYLSANDFYPGPYPNGAPFITVQPASQIVDVLNSATFSVAAIGASPLSCQWQFDGTNIAGATASSYTIPYVEETNVGWYVAVVSNAFGAVTSAVATLTTFTSPPVIIAEPTNVAVYDGDPALFSVTAIGPPPLAYQWNFNGANISGATNSSLNLPDVQAANAGSYFVVVTNSFGSATSVVATLTRSNRAPVFVCTPISQTVVEGDTVTFAARAIGTEPITYQWQKCNFVDEFTNLPGQTSSRYVDVNMQYGDGGTYAVIVANAIGANSYTNAVLDDASTNYGIYDWGVMPVFGPRQDYTFQAYNTYYIYPGGTNGFPTNVVDLYGTTTIQGGAVIKFDYDEWATYWWEEPESIAALVLHGSLVCDTAPYNPAVLTSVDDDSQGEQPLVWWALDWNIIPPDVSSSYPATAGNGCAFLDLGDVHSTNITSISNLRFCYAALAVTTPTNSGVLDVWNCQFLECSSALNSLGNGPSTNRLHNVLFSDCSVAIMAQTNLAELDGEQVTADVWSFWNPNFAPGKVSLTNSIVVGEFGRGVIINNQNTMVNPSPSPFEWGDDASYYLAANSACRSAGTTNISTALKQILRQKTTSAPISISGNLDVQWISGQTFSTGTAIGVNEMTLFPSVKRYDGGSPDLGFYYDALDYTVAAMYVTNKVTVLPGTAIAFRNDFIGGLFLQDGSSLVAQGTPTNPIVFTDVQLVQEGPLLPGQVYMPNNPGWNGLLFLYGGIDFICPQAGTNTTSVAPVVDMRFCHFYSTADDFPLWAGTLTESPFLSFYCFSWACSVNWDMQDCTLQGGQIVLGQPSWNVPNEPLTLTSTDATNYAAGEILWKNNLFDCVSITLDPSCRTNDGSGNDGVTNLDFPVFAYNNTFTREGFNATYGLSQADIIIAIPTSKGDWVFQNNLFDSVTLIQGGNEPVIAGHNGYWCADFNTAWNDQCEYDYFPSSVVSELSSNDTSGNVILSSPPPYQVGPYGKNYLATDSTLANAGSTTADQLGLYHYTTVTNQTIQGTSRIDIGFHYLAASSNSVGVWLPLDTDGDGIPDYVEDAGGSGATGSAAISLGETDWLNPKTDGVNFDPSNAVYLNVDLDGDGMVGLVESDLSKNPILFDTPLALYPVNTPLAPGTNTFEVYVPYSLLISNGVLELMADGLPAEIQVFEAGDGNTLIAWDAMNNPPGESYYLQSHLVLNGSGVTADGPLLLFNQPLIGIQSTALTNGLGGSVTFTTAPTGPAPYGYQWLFDGSLIAGATGSSLTLTNLGLTNEGEYSVIITNQAGDSLTSSNILFVVTNISVGIVTQPMSQAVFEPDSVSFAVTAVGADLNYQWGRLDGSGNFTAISNGTSSNYSIAHINSSCAGTYAVLVSIGTNLGGTNAILSTAAVLTDEGYPGFPFMPLIGPRQNYVFKENTTYLIGYPSFLGNSVDLHGCTTFEGGTFIKFSFDDGLTNASLVIHGSLSCLTTPYRPVTLTSDDDAAQGEPIVNAYGGTVGTVPVGTVYLNLDDAHSPNPISITNFRFFYADQAITTPTNSGVLDVWDSQFCDCNSGINSRMSNGCSTNRLHNVLFSSCDFAVATQNSCAIVEGEQVTADVASFCDPEYFPSDVRMTNCILRGPIGDVPSVSTLDVAIPSAWPFQSVNDGNYYLPAGSPYRSNGTTAISPGMAADLTGKTTCAPISFPANMTISGQLTLFPQAKRYAGGTPDLGYFYDPLDYTMADMNLQGGSMTVLPNTAIGFRNDYFSGLNLGDNSLFTSRGTPTQPITFVDNTIVQEGPFAPGQVYNQYWSPTEANGIVLLPYGGPAFFNPYPYANDNWDAAPQMNMRFCNFYLTPDDFGLVAGSSAGYSGGFPFSPSSSVVWYLQDCSVYGGQIVLGDQEQSTTNSPGLVAWTNNLFEDSLLILEPSYGTGTNAAYVDLPFFAYNNLFKNGVLAVSPIPTSQGNWQIKNNLFDNEDFLQDTSRPLDYNYNGYWTNLGSVNLVLDAFLDGHLTPAQTDDGSTDGSNEQTLTNPPPYRKGPFGNYYMAPGTLLANNGSTTADQLGFYHYTTGTNQFAQSNSTIDIGLHYLAASNGASGWVPLDTDGDGIPDYVEDATGTGATGASAVALGETDWTTQYTVAGVWDPTNSVYDDIDLSGDGIVGAIKIALGMNTFDSGTPLAMVEITTGEEASIATFSIPISYSALTNIASLDLDVNGLGATLDACSQATNGNCLLAWNTTYDPPFLHFIQPHLTMFAAGPGNSLLSATGPIIPFYSSNVLQFSVNGSMFDETGAYLEATLPSSNASYTVQLYDPTTSPRTLIATITDSTTNSLIQENWGVTNSDGTSFMGDFIDAVFQVSLADPASGSSTKHLVRATNGMTESGPNFDFTYFYTPQTAENPLNPYFGSDGVFWDGMLSVVDTLTMPDMGYDVYQSFFDHYYCYDCSGSLPYPGYLSSLSIITSNLFPDMANGLTKQFYCYGHGSPVCMDCYAHGSDPYAPHFLQEDIAALLQNTADAAGHIVTQNPYRFVFLDGCSTASRPKWEYAFGIYPLGQTNSAAMNHVGEQALVGWSVPIEGWAASSVQAGEAYTVTLSLFYYEWMNGEPLAICIADASENSYGLAPFPVKGMGYENSIELQGPDYDITFSRTNKPPNPIQTGNIYVIGHSGLTITGCNYSMDGFYSRPQNR